MSSDIRIVCSPMPTVNTKSVVRKSFPNCKQLTDLFDTITLFIVESRYMSFHIICDTSWHGTGHSQTLEVHCTDGTCLWGPTSRHIQKNQKSDSTYS
jgi:hypothetical protein